MGCRVLGLKILGFRVLGFQGVRGGRVLRV